MPHERRHAERQPVSFYIEHFRDEESLRYFATDISRNGLYLERPVEPNRPVERALQLEIRLPDRPETIWASAELVYQRNDALFHGCGVRFTAMSDRHASHLREWLREHGRTERFITHPDRRPRALSRCT